MAKRTFLESDFTARRSEIAGILKQLQKLTEAAGHQPMIETVGDLLERITEPFLFVIVGEVKAGKSSFINALLDTGRDICAVAPSPMTDTIQQITYGATEHVEIISQYLKRIYIPEPILKDIAIVDTPGTNTIIEHHQEITERFIPGSDLIVFVFEAKNPYRQSSWEFFDFIHDDWKKKVVFVLQQKDLMSADDLAINHAGVKKLAGEKGIKDPVIFDVSAKQEQEGNTSESGFGPLRDYLNHNITGGNAPLLKLRSTLETATTIANRIGEAITLRKQQFEADSAFREEIRQDLENQKRIAKNQVDLLVNSLSSDYDRIARQKGAELENVLSFTSVLGRSIRSIFSKKSSLKEWLDSFSNDLDQALASGLHDQVNQRVGDLAESIQQMGHIVDLKIRSSKTILPNDSEIFADIAERRTRVLTDLREAFKGFLSNTENFADQEILAGSERVTPRIFTGSGMTVVGVALAALTNGAVFDITGGVLTTIGLLFTGITLGIQRRKIMRRYQEEMSRGKKKLESEVRTRLNNYIGEIHVRIDANFNVLDQHLEQEGRQIQNLESDFQNIVAELAQVRRSLPKA